MIEIDIPQKQQSIFARLLLLSNKFQTIGNRIFDGELTLAQWLMTLAVAQCGDDSPTIGRASELMGCSHQNVKQIAMRLERAGFLSMEKDEGDRRVIHLSLTEKSFVLWKRHREEIRNYLDELFKDLNEGEIDSLYDCIDKLHERVSKMEKSVFK